MARGATAIVGLVLLTRTVKLVMVVSWHDHASTFCDLATHQILLEGLVTSRSALTTLKRVARAKSAARGRKFISLTIVIFLLFAQGVWVLSGYGCATRCR